MDDLQTLKFGSQVKIVVEGKEVSGTILATHPDNMVAVGVSRLVDAERDNYTDDIYPRHVSEVQLA